MSLMDIFYELNQRYPTPEEADQFEEEVSLHYSFSEVHADLPEESRAREIEQLLEQSAEQVSVDEIYAQFKEKIQGIHLDRMIQTVTYFWKVGQSYYADDLKIVTRID